MQAEPVPDLEHGNDDIHTSIDALLEDLEETMAHEHPVTNIEALLDTSMDREHDTNKVILNEHEKIKKKGV